MTIYAIFYVLAAVLYLAAAFGIYKSFQAETPENTFWIRPVIVGGLMIQAFLIYEALFTHGTPHFGLALALSITLFTCTLILLIETLFSKISAMLIFILPLAAGFNGASYHSSWNTLRPGNCQFLFPHAPTVGYFGLQLDDNGIGSSSFAGFGS